MMKRFGASRVTTLLSLGVLAATQATAARADGPPATRLAVMVFNIEYGGAHVAFDKVVEAILSSHADVVGVEEAEGNIPRLAQQLGWPSYDTRLQIVSRYPLIDPPGGDGAYVFVEVAPGRVVAMANVHLPSDPYGPTLARDGEPPDKVLALERRLRLAAIQPRLARLPGLVRAGIPVFLTGDFNAPSHRDWVAAATGSRKQLRYALDWPVSQAVEQAGFLDSYRAVHPDPLGSPGLTWWAGRARLPGWNPEPDDPQDRIDFVYAAGATTPSSSSIVGEPGVPGVDVAVTPWPSDHRAVVSTFSVTPAPMPALVAVARRLLTLGEGQGVRFHSPGKTADRVVIAAANADPTTSALLSQPTPAGSRTDGTLGFATAQLKPGAYQAALLDASGDVLAKAPFWLAAPDTKPQVETAKTAYRTGEPVQLTWRWAPGNRWDWVGVYRAGADPRVDSFMLWRHTNGSIEGTATLDRVANEGEQWPLPSGDYDAYLLADDGYDRLATTTFSVGR